MKEDPTRLTVGIITFKPEEMKPVLQRLGPGKDIRGRRWYRVGELETDVGGAARIVVVNAGEQGGVSAADCTRDLLADFDVDIVAVVGIGGGLPSTDYTLGDVVVARSVQDLRVRAVLRDGSEEISAVGARTSRVLTDLLDYLPAIEHRVGGWSSDTTIQLERPVVDMVKIGTYGPPEWQEDVRASLRHHFVVNDRKSPLVLVGPIASSDGLIKNAEYAEQVLAFARHVIAFEMEASGVFKAADSARVSVPVLVVKGVSDIVGLARDAAWTGYAATAAAEWTIHMIRSGLLAETLGRPDPSGDSAEFLDAVARPAMPDPDSPVTITRGAGETE